MKDDIFSIIQSITGVNLPDEPYDIEMEVAGIDSISFIQIIIEVEEKYNVEFDDESLYYGDYPDIRSFFELIESKLSSVYSESSR